MKFIELDHFSHPHRLLQVSLEVPFQCNGCKELGFGLCYHCPYEECNFHLHKECANAPACTSHPFLKRCNFKFHKENPKLCARFYNACGLDINCFLSQCSHEDAHDIHLCCAPLPKSLSNNGETIYLINQVRSKCLKCNKKEIANGVRGGFYVSSYGNYCYHVACVKEAIIENWQSCYFQLGAANGSNGLQLQNSCANQELAV